ncbi:allophanate hydrolase [Thalassobaculum sp. OXR-137]|uniref:allophanate hydrolase n=1 Tax=Thalassobaculum sp. OXR-137 TaxID=3100173 RepID=UPI002AC899A6|nr:allophanate hydrolase [Thalassobaculum sp. OXR-137]WPZ34575.1 allophanate hydrolase [Thalassobaculum sp. OXR-137]
MGPIDTLQDLPFDIASLHAAYESGAKPGEIVAECYRRIAAAGDPGIFITLIDPEKAQLEAARLGPFDRSAKPLWGVPFAIKDNIDAGGETTTAGCPAYAYEAEVDAFTVAKLRAAGAILVGKTNLDQFATGLVGVRSPYPVPKNALDPEIVPGGSSSGSAVAVARGLVSFALGTDTAGSGRVPAALNNIVGLKPTVGSLSASGLVPACRTVDTISVFALTVEDAYRAFQSAAGHDPADAFSKAVATPDLGTLPPKLTIGIPDAGSLTFFGDGVQAASYAAALEAVRAAGGETVELDFTPFYQVAEMLYGGVWVAERHAVVGPLMDKDPEAVHPVIRQIVGAATRFSATDTFNSLYRMEALRRTCEAAMAGIDMLCVPTIPTFFTVADLEADPIGPNSTLGTYTNFVNLLGLCGIAVPTGVRSDGRPASVTLLARAGRDGLSAALASRLHRGAGVTLGATGWPLPQVAEPTPTPGADEIVVAAVGAHMSGLPLNGELTRLGGRFLAAASTAPGYRLYRLAGGPPFRPGLVRDATGSAIALELWALPLDRFGAFMAGIPAPLGIGTVTLADGRTVNGFICEVAGLQGATDITEFGGWRAYLAAAAGRQGAVP